MSSTEPNVNISLEPHLILVLEPLIPIIDPSLSSKLAGYLAEPKKPTIPYALLQSVSQWSRSPAGSSALRNCSPPLDPSSYLMISLLAGTTTSPERKFGAHVPPPEPDLLAFEKKSERKAITTIVNGVFSVIGSGAAAWLGSEKTNWKQEWRILFALAVAVIVALSETVLYILWQSRSHSSPTKLRKRRYIRAKKVDDGEGHDVETVEERPDGLRLRIQANSNDED